MPICKNNPKRTYTGKEPSPKGLGYCASGEKEGVKIEGKDGHFWIKKKGRWIRDNYIIDIHKSCKKYMIHDNGGRPFLVCIKNKDAFVYKLSSAYNEIRNEIKNYFYNELIAKYHFDKIFIGKSPLTDTTKYSAGYGPKFDGNSILLKIKDKYVFIGQDIYEFKPKNEIIAYYSPVGNNDVPYPVAFTKENVYFMLDKTYVPLHYFEDFNNKELIDAYSYYWAANNPLNKYAKKMIGVKIIEKRQY